MSTVEIWGMLSKGKDFADISQHLRDGKCATMFLVMTFIGRSRQDLANPCEPTRSQMERTARYICGDRPEDAERLMDLCTTLWDSLPSVDSTLRASTLYAGMVHIAGTMFTDEIELLTRGYEELCLRRGLILEDNATIKVEDQNASSSETNLLQRLVLVRLCGDVSEICECRFVLKKCDEIIDSICGTESFHHKHSLHFGVECTAAIQGKQDHE